MLCYLFQALLLLTCCVIGMIAQFSRTLNSNADCSNIYSLSRTGMDIYWNGAVLNCSMEIKSKINILDQICVQMRSVDLNCGSEVTFITSFSRIPRKTWGCASGTGFAVCTSDSTPNITIRTVPVTLINSFRLRVYTSRDQFTNIATTAVKTAYNLIAIIAGVVVGVIVLIIVVCVAVCLCCCRKSHTHGHVVTHTQPGFQPNTGPGGYPL